jgi:hypothetical protein
MVDQAAEDTDARQLPKEGDTSEDTDALQLPKEGDTSDDDEYENKDNY